MFTYKYLKFRTLGPVYDFSATEMRKILLLLTFIPESKVYFVTFLFLKNKENSAFANFLTTL